MTNYYDLDIFKYIYLEDSFVLNIKETNKELSFTVVIVLLEEHHLYTLPKTNEQYCYKNGKIIFENLKSIKWLHKYDRPSIDADGTIDYGNIDTFIISQNGYYLSGDWGEVQIRSDPVRLLWLDEEKVI